MIDTRLYVINGLKAISLPVYNEHFITSKCEVPCISYMLTNDIQNETGQNLMYAKHYYSIKVYTKSTKEIAEYSQKVDKIMRDIGFTRTATNELWLGEICQFEMKYSGLAIEYMEDE